LNRIVCGALVTATLFGATAVAKPLPLVRIVLVGDSTMATGSGYGDALCALFKQVQCVNMAKGGRSTKSYRAEGSWEKVLALLMDKGEFAESYVLIQFGHNDQPGKAERSTSLPEFAENLERYVQDVRAAGATPVLVTPLTRRQFRNGKLIRNLQSWAQATQEAATQTGAPLVDLHRKSVKAVQQMGAAEAATLAEAPPPANVLAAAQAGTTIETPKLPPADASTGTRPEPMFDYTHLGPKGAEVFAAVVAKELRQNVPTLKRHLRAQSR